MNFVANTWIDFLSAVREAREQLGNPPIVWYRGQARSDYKLLPSLSRFKNGTAKEQALFDEYERSASHLQNPRESDWQLLNDMQHYGIPTRLLDWTDVLGIALAFALYNNYDDSEESAIYLLDPVQLNLLSGVQGIKRAHNDPAFGYKNVYWHGSPFKAFAPIAIDSVLHNERMRAQNGSFTVQGTDMRPLDEQAPHAVRKIILGPEAKPAAREFLEHANLNAFSIYPDIVGMARHIRRKHLGV